MSAPTGERPHGGDRAANRGDGSGGFNTFSELRAGKLSRAIDRLVVELYGLTEEEIRLVEEAVGESA